MAEIKKSEIAQDVDLADLYDALGVSETDVPPKVVQLAHLMATEPAITMAQAAKQLGVSERTIYRLKRHKRPAKSLIRSSGRPRGAKPGRFARI